MTKKFLSLKETAEYLGISKSSAYKLSHKQIIPKYKPAGKIYFELDDINKYIEDSRIKSQSEIESEAQSFLLADVNRTITKKRA